MKFCLLCKDPILLGFDDRKYHKSCYRLLDRLRKRAYNKEYYLISQIVDVVYLLSEVDESEKRRVFKEDTT